MLQVFAGTRENSSVVKCECGEKVYLAMHHDFIEGACSCGEHYRFYSNFQTTIEQRLESFKKK